MPRVLIAAPPDLIDQMDGSLLRRSGVEQIAAVHSDQAFEAVRSAHPDMAILGETEEGDAIALLRRLRTDATTRAMFLAVISRRPPTQLEEAALRRAGANVVLTGDGIPDMSDEAIDQLLDVPIRQEARVPVRFVVWSHVGPDGPTLEGRTLNVSVRGVLLETPEPVAVGSKLELTFTLPDDDVPIRAVGRVVREHPSSGGTQVGVEFLIFRDFGRNRIRAWVSRARH
jgi:CheY-like chemotaxis protein